MQLTSGYFKATRHPWSCLVFVLPLLLAYELGILALGLDEPQLMRNGADAWLRWVLATLGLRHLLWAPCLLLAVLTIWHLCVRDQRPGDSVGLWMGMTVESVLFALMLWGGCHALGPVLQHLGVQLTSGQQQPDPAMLQLLCFVGAGIYEETLFRLLLFSCLRWVLLRIEIPWPGAALSRRWYQRSYSRRLTTSGHTAKNFSRLCLRFAPPPDCISCCFTAGGASASPWALMPATTSWWDCSPRFDA